MSCENPEKTGAPEICHKRVLSFPIFAISGIEPKIDLTSYVAKPIAVTIVQSVTFHKCTLLVIAYYTQSSLVYYTPPGVCILHS